MRKLEARDSEAMNKWATVLKSRMETGEPYIMYKDNVNKDNPIAYRLNNLECIYDKYLFRNYTIYR